MFMLKLIFRNALRHKLRSSLTVVGIAIAVLAFGLLRTLVAAWYLGVESSSASRLVTRNAISLIFTVPASYQEKIRQVPGVTMVSYGNWFGGVDIGGLRETESIWPSVLPSDIDGAVRNAVALVQSGIQSRRTANASLGGTDPESEMSRVLDEAKNGVASVQ